MCQTALTGRRNSIPAASGAVRPVLTWRDLKHRTLKPASGAHHPVQCRFAIFSAHESGGHRTRPVPNKERPVHPRRALKACAQGLRMVVFLSSADFAQAARALVRRSPPPPSSSSNLRGSRSSPRGQISPPASFLLSSRLRSNLAGIQGFGTLRKVLAFSGGCRSRDFFRNASRGSTLFSVVSRLLVGRLFCNGSYQERQWSGSWLRRFPRG